MQPLHLLIKDANQTVRRTAAVIITKVEGAPRANSRDVFMQRNVPKAPLHLLSSRAPPLFARSIAIHRQLETLGISLTIVT